MSTIHTGDSDSENNLQAAFHRLRLHPRNVPNQTTNFRQLALRHTFTTLGISKLPILSGDKTHAADDLAKTFIQQYGEALWSKLWIQLDMNEVLKKELEGLFSDVG